MTTINHDPFARQTTEREIVHHYGEKKCQWCGSSGKVLKHGRYRLFRYTTRSFYAPRFENKTFCSLGCWQTYHN